MQIRAKLTIRYFLVSAMLLSGALFLIYFSFKRQLENQFYVALKTNAMMTFTLMERSNPDFDKEPLEIYNKGSRLTIKDDVLIFNDRNQLLFSFSGEKPIDDNILEKIKKVKELKFPIGNFEGIGVLHKASSGKEFIIISKGDFMSDELDSLKIILTWTFIVFLVLSVIAGYYSARKALSPINELMNELDSIQPGDLTTRLTSSDNKDEITRLTEAFNSLLDRIEEAFNIQKGFISFISHEIRNPLGAMISRLEVSKMKERTVNEYKENLDSLLTDARELEQTGTQLMQLARITSNNDKIMYLPVRVDEIIWDVCSVLRKNNPHYKIEFQSSELPNNPDELIVKANEVLLKTALTNLIDNACKYSRDNHARIRINVVNQHKLSIDIIDNADVINEDDKKQIFKPFYRANSLKKIPGTGIGLSLVALIMKVHKFSLNISQNSGEGNVFTLNFFEESKVSEL